MSNNYIHIGTLNDHSQDHSKHVTINAPGADISSLVRSIFADDVTPSEDFSSVSPESYSDIPLFKFIHVAVTDDKERIDVHKMVCNIVRLPKMQLVCDELYKLMKNMKVLSTINPEAMLGELRRMGLPSADTPGFSDKNFYFYYKAPKID
jgi:hypothetical protein